MLQKTNPLKSACIQAGLWSAAVLFVTSVHHLYGAIVYSTPWRHHVVPPAILTTLFIAAMLFVFFRRSGTLAGNMAFWLAAGSIFIVPVGFFGIFEGAYNHVLKDVLYFSGVTESVLYELFPPPTYEMPNNLFFEATGVLTFFLALPAAYSVYRLISIRRSMSRTGLAGLEKAA